MAKVPVGTIACVDCRGVADVLAMKKGGGHYLYTNCPVCKVDQRTGKPVQERLFNGTQWAAGQQPIVPPNVVSEDWKPGGQGEAKPLAAKPAKNSEPLAVSSESSKKAEKPPGAAFLGVLSLLALLLGSVVVLKKGGKPQAAAVVVRSPYGD